MNGEWSGGKGSVPRKTNMNKYRDNFDAIFRKKKQMALLVDSYLEPNNIPWNDIINPDDYEWVIAKNYEEFVLALNGNTFNHVSISSTLPDLYDTYFKYLSKLFNDQYKQPPTYTQHNTVIVTVV